MRPHRLRVTAFGPFPGTVDLDLDQVSAAGPFLLRGSTGAGKTSLLDAVGYALFGRVPGARGHKQLRSDHAAAGVRTVVELWATVGGRAVHVVRTPDQQRPKARGTGTTTDKATVSVRVARDLLGLAADDCQARWSGVQEANDELARLVGMTHEQFVQVVLLPQGDFARFLRAHDDERADVLRALFDTSRFHAVEQQLRRRRDDTRAALAAADAGVGEAANRVAAHADADQVPAASLTGWASGLLAEAEQSSADATGAAGAAAAVAHRARDDHDAARTRAAVLLDLAAASRTWTSVQECSATVAVLAEELARAEQALDVVAPQAAHRQAHSRALAARAEAAAAVATLGRLGLLPPGCAGLQTPDAAAVPDTPEAPDVPDAPGAPDLVAVSAAVVAVAQGALDAGATAQALGADVRAWQAEQAGLAARQVAAGAAEEGLSRVRASAEALPGRAAHLAAKLAASRETASGLGVALRDVQRWEDLLERADRLAAEDARALTAERADLGARALAREAEEHLDALRAARLAGMSAELAAGLVPGEPCTVCGATEHPAPAPRGGSPVSAEQEDAARRAAAHAGTASATAHTRLAGATAARDATLAGLHSGAAPEVQVPAAAPVTADVLTRIRADLAGRATAAATRSAQAQRAEVEAAATAAELERVQDEQAHAGEVLAEAERERAVRQAAVVEAVDRSERLHASLQVSLGARVATDGPAAVWADLLATAEQHLRAARSATDAVTALRAAADEVDRARATAEACATAAGWSGPEEALAASRPRAWLEDARRQVRAHERELHAAEQRLHELVSLAGLHGAGLDGAGLDAVGLDGAATAVLLVHVEAALVEAARHETTLAGALAEATERCRSAEEVATRATSVRDRLRRSVPALVRAERGTGPLRAEAEAARALADLCTGSNEKGVALSTYVLAAHLEHVVEAANLRLEGMSDGRYALVHVEEGEDRRRRAGLGLAVLDAWTGRQRPAGTLSGGETFLASLALALGLADVVTSEAGGARIDALFVDEGFGTLDPESLDRAMDVLDQLQEHGRMVGVVSHVGELQQRLPRQVCVEAGRTGSTARVSVG